MLFTRAPKHTSEVLSRVLKCENFVTCLMKKKMIDKLCSGMSYNAIGCELNANELTTRYINEKEEEIHQPVFKVALKSPKVKSVGYEEAVKSG